MGDAADFVKARDLLLARRTEYAGVRRDFRLPRLSEFNWAIDYFDVMAAGNDNPALWIVEESGEERRLSFATLASRSNQVANWLREQGVRRHDRVLLMLGNEVALWETMLAAIKLGAVVVPATSLLTRDDLCDRLTRGSVRHVVAASDDATKFELEGDYTRIAVGAPRAGWRDFAASNALPDVFVPDGPTRATDPLLLYFTSGTTSKPKLVLHTHQSYPVGHLSTMYWIGLQSGRHSSQRFVPRVGQARMELFFCSVERGRLRLHLQLRALQRAGAPLGDRALSCHNPLRAPYGMAHARPGGHRDLPRTSRRFGVARCGRAAQPRDHRARSRSLGHHHTRRLRADRDDRHDRQLARAAGEAGLDGSSATWIRRGIA